MNIEGQEMEKYQIFVFVMVNAGITEELEFQIRESVLKNQSREDLDDKEAPKYSLAPIDKTEKQRRI